MEDIIDNRNKRLTDLDRAGTGNSQSHSCQVKTSCILVVTRNGHIHEAVMDYAVNVADRMKYKLLVTYINTLPLLWDGGQHRRLFAAATQESAVQFKMKAAARGVELEYVRESGRVGQVIKRVCQIVKRVEFVVIDQGIKMEEASSGAPVPVFNVVCTDSATGKKTETRQLKKLLNGEKIMAPASRKNYLGKTILFGSVTAALYAAVFVYQEAIMHYWAKGGIYTLLPVATVFVFSYAHGSFTSNFWSALGIEGSKATVSKQTVKRDNTAKNAEKRPDTRPRVQASA